MLESANNDKIKTYSHTKDNIEQNRGGAAATNKNGEKKTHEMIQIKWKKSNCAKSE